MATGEHLNSSHYASAQDELHRLFLGRRGISVASLVIVNLIPLLGVFQWGWDVGS